MECAEKSKIATLEEMIDELPENFPKAVDIIKNEIALKMTSLDEGLIDHYIRLIKKKTNAESVTSVKKLVEPTIQAITASALCPCHTEMDEPEIDPKVREMAERFAVSPTLFRDKIDMVNLLGVLGERKNIGIYQLVIDSRLLPLKTGGSQALAVKNSGHHGAGKSYPLLNSLRLYPDNAYHFISNGSAKSLYQLDDGLKHKALILAEAAALEARGDNELAYAIRSLISEGYVGYQRTECGGIVLYKVEGPTSLVTTTIKGRLEKQLDDRIFTIHPDTSSSQTEKIITRRAMAACGNKDSFDEESLKAWQLYHDLLESYQVVIPYADKLIEPLCRQSLPVSARRAFDRVLSAIKTLTLLYQAQRKTDESGNLIADIADFAMAYQLVEEAFLESLADPSRYSDKRINLIAAEGIITVRSLAEKAGVAKPTISQWIKPLVEKGTLAWCDEHGKSFEDENALVKAKGKGIAYICVMNKQSLPTPYELTGDPRWDNGGELYEMYNLYLDDDGPVMNHNSGNYGGFVPLAHTLTN
jgi:hypothetical protein